MHMYVFSTQNMRIYMHTYVVKYYMQKFLCTNYTYVYTYIISNLNELHAY